MNAVKIQKIREKSNETQRFFARAVKMKEWISEREIIMLQASGCRLQVAGCNLKPAACCLHLSYKPII